MTGRRLLGLLLASAALLGAGHGDDLDDFNLEDALHDPTIKRPTPKAPRKPAGGTGDFDLADYFDTPLGTTTKPAKPTPKPFPRPGKPDNSFWDVVRTTTTKQPKTTRAPPKDNPGKNPMELDLADALNDNNDWKDPGKPNVKPDNAFSDDDLASIVDGGYAPDKKKGGEGNTDTNYSAPLSLFIQQTQWRRGQSLASPVPWLWHLSGLSPATSPTSRRSFASASSRDLMRNT
ncbi:CD99 antigen-like protein 2 isoform X2 [Cuculus canorus]|uniref:CD99 antigen-like protein 2 isoform X2 n=1 Tax=Cuculus canorus TaxID=55661 RepID=UPI0023AB3E58|nr:CD99 antigen-like protein 2 isoform X2 [Cuculus canorus]